MHADEILMCAGAIHTPAILQRSGVAPTALLSELGIEQVVDLPVRPQAINSLPLLAISRSSLMYCA